MATGSGSTSSSSFASMLRKAKAGRPIKSQSVPPLAAGLSTSDSLTCMEYEQLNFIPINNGPKKATSAPMSASSSRSESPMSDRYCGKCSSLISLHLRHSIYIRTVMPCPFTGPKIFCAGPNFLCQTKNLFTYCGSHKHFVPHKKLICIQ